MTNAELPLDSAGRETLQWIAAGGYVRRDGARVELRALPNAAIASTWVLPEAEAHAAAAACPPPPAGLAPRVECWTLRSGACVQRLLAEGAARVAVLTTRTRDAGRRLPARRACAQSPGTTWNNPSGAPALVPAAPRIFSGRGSVLDALLVRVSNSRSRPRCQA